MFLTKNSIATIACIALMTLLAPHGQLYSNEPKDGLEPAIICKAISEEEEEERAKKEAAFREKLPAMTLASLIDNINECCDPIHCQLTPAIDEIVRRGDAVLPDLVPHLNNEDEAIRFSVEQAIARITYRQFGYNGSHPMKFREDEWRDFWARLGNYQWNMPVEGRLKAMKLWEQELEGRKQCSGGPEIEEPNRKHSEKPDVHSHYSVSDSSEVNRPTVARPNRTKKRLRLNPRKWR